jgi:hypothetical protein
VQAQIAHVASAAQKFNSGHRPAWIPSIVSRERTVEWLTFSPRRILVLLPLHSTEVKKKRRIKSRQRRERKKYLRVTWFNKKRVKKRQRRTKGRVEGEIAWHNMQQRGIEPLLTVETLTKAGV